MEFVMYKDMIKLKMSLVTEQTCGLRREGEIENLKEWKTCLQSIVLHLFSV